jgi:hypothetical protein
MKLKLEILAKPMTRCGTTEFATDDARVDVIRHVIIRGKKFGSGNVSEITAFGEIVTDFRKSGIGRSAGSHFREETAVM